MKNAPVSRWASRVCCALAVAGVLAGIAASASVAAPLVWSGMGTAPDWSQSANWMGNVAPSLAEPTALEFPRLNADSCNFCYQASNDIAGLAVSSLRLYDGMGYQLSGDPILLGVGGLTTIPSETEGLNGEAHIALPIELSASQVWSLSGASGAPRAEVDLDEPASITGTNDALTIDVTGSAALRIWGSVETGPLTLQGVSGRGEVEMWEPLETLQPRVNAADGKPVTARNVILSGNGVTGPLIAESSEIVLDGDLEAQSVSLDSASSIVFSIRGRGLGRTEHDELVADGPIDLGQARLVS